MWIDLEIRGLLVDKLMNRTSTPNGPGWPTVNEVAARLSVGNKKGCTQLWLINSYFILQYFESVDT